MNNNKKKPVKIQPFVPKTVDKVIALIIVGIWSCLFIFWIISLTEPKWLTSLSEKGSYSESMEFKTYGDIFLRKNDFASAAEQYKSAVSTNDSNLDAKINLALCYSKMGNYRESIRIYESVLNDKRTIPYSVYYNIGQIYENLGQPSTAIKNYQAAIKTDPFPFYNYLKIADIYNQLENWDESIVYFSKCLDNKIDLQNSYTGSLKRDFYIMQNEPKHQNEIKKLLNEKIKPAKLYQTYDRTIFDNILSSDMTMARINNQIGYAYAMKDNLDTALYFFNRAIEIWPGFPDANRNRKLAISKLTRDKK